MKKKKNGHEPMTDWEERFWSGCHGLEDALLGDSPQGGQTTTLVSRKATDCDQQSIVRHESPWGRLMPSSQRLPADNNVVMK